jgi:hypothetical protein
VTIPKGRYTGDDALAQHLSGPIPESDYTFTEKAVVAIDFEMGRVRFEQWTETLDFRTGRFVPDHSVDVYDGRRFLRAVPIEQATERARQVAVRQPEFYHFDEDHGVSFFHVHYYPLFFGQSLFSEASVDVLRLRRAPSRDAFRLHGKSLLGNRNCMVLHTVPTEAQSAAFTELWVDPSSNGSVMRWRRYSSGHLLADIHCDYRRDGDTDRLAGWMSVVLLPADTVYEVRTVRIVEMILNAPLESSLFSLSPRIGSIVQDLAGRLYREGPDGKKQYLDESPGSGARPGLLLLAGIIGVIVASYTVRFFHRRGASL